MGPGKKTALERHLSLVLLGRRGRLRGHRIFAYGTANMSLDAFEQISLTNRLGQEVGLGVKYVPGDRRDTLFVCAPRQQASSLFGKNAEQFIFQLMERMPLEPERLDLIEVRGDDGAPEFWRWRLNWVGRSPLAPRSELVGSSGSRAGLLALLTGEPEVLSAQARRTR